MKAEKEAGALSNPHGSDSIVRMKRYVLLYIESIIYSMIGLPGYAINVITGACRRESLRPTLQQHW
jgi:hypothetical protein